MNLWRLLIFLFVYALAIFPGSGQGLITTLQEPDTIKPLPKSDSIPQRDFIDIIAKWVKTKNVDEKRNNRKFHFSLFPTESNISGGRTVFTSVNVAFLLGDKSTTHVSTIYFIPYISFDGRYGIQLRPNIWLEGNSWNFTGEYFFLNYPQNTWGLGGNTSQYNETLIDYKQIRFHQNALKKIFPSLFLGLGYAYDYHYNIDVEETGAGEEIVASYPIDSDKSMSSGFTLPIKFDNRNNSINPANGFFTSLTYSVFSKSLGSTSDWQSLFVDARKYIPIPHRKTRILAFRSYYWTILSGEVPYLDLPSTRWEPIIGTSSRGFPQSRYRSNALLYFESEYRFDITDNGLFGGVLFLNLNSASDYGTQQFTYWKPAGGAGLRMKFNKYSRTNVTLDFAFSRDYWTVYLNIGEAF